MKKEITIVGPSPSQNEAKKGGFSGNVECLLLMAKYNRSFRKKILNKPETAFDLCNIPLKESDKLLLTATPKNQLKQIIDNFQIEGITKRSLVNWKLASVVLALISSISVGIGQISEAELVSLQGAMAENLWVAPAVPEGYVTGRVLPAIDIKLKRARVFLNGEEYKADKFGSFMLRANEGDVLLFKAPGHLSKEVVVESGKAIYLIPLEKKEKS